VEDVELLFLFSFQTITLPYSSYEQKILFWVPHEQYDVDQYGEVPHE